MDIAQTGNSSVKTGVQASSAGHKAKQVSASLTKTASAIDSKLTNISSYSESAFEKLAFANDTVISIEPRA